MKINLQILSLRLFLRNFLISISMTFFASEVAIAGNNTDFEVGSSCATIIFSEADSIMWLVESLSGEELESFCYPEEPSYCSDYSALVEDIGLINESQIQTDMCKLSIKR